MARINECERKRNSINQERMRVQNFRTHTRWSLMSRDLNFKKRNFWPTFLTVIRYDDPEYSFRRAQLHRIRTAGIPADVLQRTASTYRGIVEIPHLFGTLTKCRGRRSDGLGCHGIQVLQCGRTSPGRQGRRTCGYRGDTPTNVSWAALWRHYWTNCHLEE